MAEVSLHKLNKKFDLSHVVKDVDLQIRDKEFMVFVGPSGCGKTTTLRMIAGLEAVTAGEIRIDDTVVNEVPPMDRDIAMVFQNYALYPHMSVASNMAFGLKMRKFEKAEIEKRINSAAAILGIESLLHRKPRQLSGGQRQRVALGRAIVRDPKVFLFDEPLSNLDAKLRVQMRVELKKLHERLAVTSIYVTHDQVEAMTLGDRVVVMKDGVVQQVGEPLELYNTPANRFVAGFIGSPAMNFADVTLVENGGKPSPTHRACGSGCPANWPREPAPRPAARRRSASARRTSTSRAPPIRPTLLRGQCRGGRAARLGDPARHAGRPGADGGERRADGAGARSRQAASSRSSPSACTCSTPRPKRRSDAPTAWARPSLRARPTWPCACRRPTSCSRSRRAPRRTSRRSGWR